MIHDLRPIENRLKTFAISELTVEDFSKMNYKVRKIECCEFCEFSQNIDNKLRCKNISFVDFHKDIIYGEVDILGRCNEFNFKKWMIKVGFWNRMRFWNKNKEYKYVQTYKRS